jgi:hypothetical protein
VINLIQVFYFNTCIVSQIENNIDLRVRQNVASSVFFASVI